MAWDDDLLPDQRNAAGHAGTHARLLAGPGTGKTFTLTRHICYLVTERRAEPDTIMAFTFTRAAARELKRRVESELGSDNCPHVSTLHSFALRQLIRNSHRITSLPQPLRIADDWEERHIILEDIKQLMSLTHIDDARKLLNELSADWQSLNADEVDWERRFPNPRFLGVWREHRNIYGYTLRSELVYQLKKALEQCEDFEIEGPIEYLIIDEYQDLNRCDLAVVNQIVSRRMELFVAGDDDQSIYGFRKAHPEGIRRFPRDYLGSIEFSLQLCKRCDREILNLGLFIARQDPRRVEKTIVTEQDRGAGEVAILQFGNQTNEANGIARLCRHLINCHDLQPDDILILLRSDRNGVFSSLIRDYIEQAHIPVAAATNILKSFDTTLGRVFLAFIRLVVNRQDSLAWHTLLNIWCEGIGPAAINAIYDAGRNNGLNFAQTIWSAHDNTDILPSSHRRRISHAIDRILNQVSILFPHDIPGEFESWNELMEIVRSAARTMINDENTYNEVLLQLELSAETVGATSLADLVHATEVVSEDIEQDIEEGKVNILTMHKAKGLTAEAVIIAAAEDQYIPGRAIGDAVNDERRLLYVSLTRARHHLFVTYCNQRTGRQRHTGRDSGRTRRSLTSFLIDGPHTPVNGMNFINALDREHR
ncbi:MAG: ATP-dependent helicase [Sedimentisphaerales bacterium]|nr:ATP-dependent helicase [Sedimentisphaerales bacterium]